MSGGYSTAKNIARGLSNSIPKMTASKISGAKKKGNKMNFIKRKLRNWLMDDADQYETISVSTDDDELNIDNQDNTMNFNVVSASGGRIVQVRYYDRKSDRHSNKLHIITPEENLAEALAHILTIETMSR
jgi:hypothetical protein